MRFRILFTKNSRNFLSCIKDKREQRLLFKRIERLSENPNEQGKALSSNLSGYRSVRAVGQRYRILYKVEDNFVCVVVFSVGLRKEGDRKDVYRLAQRAVSDFELEQFLKEELSKDDSD